MQSSCVTMKNLQDYTLKYPEIDIKSQKSNHHPEPLYISKDDLEHRLEDFVRLQYLRKLESIVRENYNLWLDSDLGRNSGLVVTDKEIRDTAQSLEIEALKGCTIVSLYRKEIIKMVNTIKNETQQSLLNGVLMKTKFNSKPNQKHVSTQTENNIVQKRISSPANFVVKDAHKKPKRAFKLPRSSNDIDVSEATLDEKIRRFQESFINTSDENPKSDPKPDAMKTNFYPIYGTIETPTRPPMTPSINLNDLLSQGKQPNQQFFRPTTPNSVISQAPSLNFQQIPATPTCLLTPASTTCTPCSSVLIRDPEDEIEQKIMQELNEIFGEDEKDPAEEIFGESIVMTMTHKTNKTERKGTSKKIENDDDQIQREDSPAIDLQMLSKMKDPEEKEKEMKEKLMSSIWPCELHHQKMRLRNVLSEIAERNFRKYERIKQRFRELFDDDDTENELAPYSPSIELDEILLASCRKRISNWVVRSLMKPYKNGQVAKFLFKRLAKYLAENIIFQDQYPSETFVKEYIYEFLCRHPRIECLEDMYL